MITFSQLAIIFIFSTLIAFIFHLLKQPLIISYIFTGLLLGNFFIQTPEVKSLMNIFSDLGIAFLLFLVGLQLKLKTLRDIGIPSIIIGTLQEIFTISAGFLVAKLLGFNFITALYLGTALSFSSTIIMIKLISDKGDLEKLYGKLAVGFLLVQDLITILILFFLPLFSRSGLLLDPLKLFFSVLAIIFVPLISYKFLPRMENFLTKSQEFLFLFSVSFGLGIASLFKYLGFGLEAGALIAGVSLSGLMASNEIISKLKPLRDFFLIMFFIYIGSQAFISHFHNLLWPTIVLSLFVLIGNPLIMLPLLARLGYSSKTSFLLGLTSAQISEFSFILINLGISLGHLHQEILSLTAMIGLITIFFSTYMFVYGEKLYDLFKNYLRLLERKRKVKEREEKKSYEVILFGCDRIGFSFLDVFKNLKKNFLIVDYNPEIVKRLKKENFEALYGDASEIDFLEELSFDSVNLVISTIPDFETNLLILEKFKKKNAEGIFIGTASKIEDALGLYQQGADFVILPYFLGGELTANFLKETPWEKENFEKIKKNQLNLIEKRIKLGQKHP